MSHHMEAATWRPGRQWLEGSAGSETLRQACAWWAGGAEGKPVYMDQSECGWQCLDARSERKAGARSSGSVGFLVM